MAKVGITSSAFVQKLLPGAPKEARSVVISLGVNDDPSMNTVDALRRMRHDIQAAHVTWLLPGPKEPVRRAIRTVAAEHGDRWVDTGGELGPDHLHPTGLGYRHIAAETEQTDGMPGARPPSPPQFATTAPSIQFAPQMAMPRVIYLLPAASARPPMAGAKMALNWPPPLYAGRAPAPLPMPTLVPLRRP